MNEFLEGDQGLLLLYNSQIRTIASISPILMFGDDTDTHLKVL